MASLEEELCSSHLPNSSGVHAFLLICISKLFFLLFCSLFVILLFLFQEDYCSGSDNVNSVSKNRDANRW